MVPVKSEVRACGNLAWIEDNRRKVDQLSGGRLGYVYLPDTGLGGFTNFNRYFFAQVEKQGVIIDERFNHGGELADYIIDYLQRKPMGDYHAALRPQTSLEPQGDLRTEGDDHQSIRRFGRRRACRGTSVRRTSVR